MRIRFIMAAAVLLGAVSCGKSHIDSPQETGPCIGFSTLWTDTRAIVGGENTFAKEANTNGVGFGVQGYYNRGDGSGWHAYMENQEVNSTVDGATYKWTYSPLKYWLNCPFRFYAYYPYDASADLDISDSAFGLTYTVPNSWANGYAADQMDFMLAAPKSVATADNGKDVDLMFYHALCQVGFKLNITDNTSDKRMQCMGLEIRNIYSTGKAAADNVGAISWTSFDNRTNYSYGYPVDDACSFVDTSVKMLVVPQELDDSDSGQVAVITVRDPAAGLTKEFSVSLKTTELSKWNPGAAYLYTITGTLDGAGSLGGLYLDVAVTVDKWKDVNINAVL